MCLNLFSESLLWHPANFDWMGGTLNSLQKRCIRLQVSLQAVPQFDVSVRDN